MNNGKENIISESLNNLDDADIEKISETVPALSIKAQKRILKNCIDRMSVKNAAEAEYEPEITVSGAEKYSESHFIRYISTVAACFLAVIGITGMIFFNRNTGSPVDDGNISSQIQPFAEITTVGKTTNQTVSVTTGSTAVISIFSTEESRIMTETSTVHQITVTETAEENTEIQTEEPVTEVISEPPTENFTTETTMELSAESFTTEPANDTAENDSFCGKYTSHENSDSGNEIEIVKTDENTYHVEVKFYRIAYLSDGIGIIDNGILTFKTGTSEGCPEITAEIALTENGCILKIIESEHSYIPADSGEGMQYYRIT